MTKFVDSEGLKRFYDNTLGLLDRKVTKKTPYGQIVIGKSINPMSYRWGTWYAFMGVLSIVIWSDNKVKAFDIHIGDKTYSVVSTGVEKANTKRAKYIHFLRTKELTAGFYQMAQEYAKGDKDIYLNYMACHPYDKKSKMLPTNLTGTSKTYSWNNGKRVTSKRGTFKHACNAIETFFKKGEKGLELCKVYKMCRTSKNQNFRRLFPNAVKKKYHTKFTRPSRILEACEYGGLYLVRFWDKNHVHMNDMKVYVRVASNNKIIFTRT